MEPRGSMGYLMERPIGSPMEAPRGIPYPMGSPMSLPVGSNGIFQIYRGVPMGVGWSGMDPIIYTRRFSSHDIPWDLPALGYFPWGQCASPRSSYEMHCAFHEIPCDFPHGTSHGIHRVVFPMVLPSHGICCTSHGTTSLPKGMEFAWDNPMGRAASHGTPWNHGISRP